jgi:hypothetical protein
MKQGELSDDDLEAVSAGLDTKEGYRIITALHLTCAGAVVNGQPVPAEHGGYCHKVTVPEGPNSPYNVKIGKCQYYDGNHRAMQVCKRPGGPV